MMLKLLFFMFFSGALWSQENSIGGFYSAQADAAVARVDDATAPVLNPAGLGSVRDNQISSGASSFKGKKAKNKEGLSLSSSTNHVSYVKELGDFNFGLMIYTFESNFDYAAKFKTSLNNEGYTRNFSSNDSSHNDNNYYTFAFAPKNSFWGASLNLASFNQTIQSAVYRQEYAQADLDRRMYKSTDSSSTVNLKLFNVVFGLQKKWKDLSFGARLNSPRFILMNDSQVVANGVEVAPVGANDVSITNYHLSSKLTPKRQFLDEGNLLVGVAYYKARFKIEIDFLLSPANNSNSFKTEDSGKFGVWFSQTDLFSEHNLEMEADADSYSKASLDPSLGFEYDLHEDLKLGFGMSYVPTDSKTKEGVNTLKVTGGFTHQYKNFKGSYSFIFVNAKDSGHNFVYSYVTEKDERVDLSYNQLGVVFSGAYYF